MMLTYPSSGQVCDRAVYTVAVPAASLCGLLRICHPATHGKNSSAVQVLLAVGNWGGTREERAQWVCFGGVNLLYSLI